MPTRAGPKWVDKKLLLGAQSDQRVLPHNRALAELAKAHTPIALEGLVVKVQIAHLLTFPPGYKAGEHVHPHFELMFLERGRMYYEVSGRKFTLQPGEMFFMPPGGLAQWRARKHKVVLQGFMCDFTPTLSMPASLGHRFNEAWLALGGRLQPGAELVAAWSALKREVTSRRSDYMKAAAAYMDLVLTLCFRAIREKLPSRSGHTTLPAVPSAERTVLAAKAFVQANLLEGISPRQIADHVGYTPRHLNRLFRAIEDCTAGEYVQKLRIERARKLLVKGEYPVKAVARMCGFADPRYFAKVFRRHAGQSPQVFARGPRS